MKKAVVFTLDATFALITASTLILASMFFFRSPTYTTPTMYSYDILTLMEKSHMLHQVVGGETQNTQFFLDNLPPNICAKIEIFNSTERIKTLVKTGCSSSNEKSIAYRVFYEQDPYLAKAEVWQ